jgi:MFS family permease
MMILNVAAFLPLYTNEKHDWNGVNKTCPVENETSKEIIYKPCSVITDDQNAIIISVFSISCIIFAPFNSFIKNKIGSKNSIILGFTIMGITTCGLGIITLINSSN